MDLYSSPNFQKPEIGGGREGVIFSCSLIADRYFERGMLIVIGNKRRDSNPAL